MMKRYKLGDQQGSTSRANSPAQGEQRDAASLRKAAAARNGKPLQAVPKAKVANADWNEF